jgi:hypothetical protein
MAWGGCSYERGTRRGPSSQGARPWRKHSGKLAKKANGQQVAKPSTKVVNKVKECSQIGKSQLLDNKSFT